MSVAIAIVLCISMVIRYRKNISVKKIVLPSILYIIVCSIAINFATMVNQAVMKKVFGAFLLVLAIYYLFFNKSDEKYALNIWVSLFCIVVSALGDGLFGIGGPLMVLYFMSTTATTYEYLGTLQTFFLVNSIYGTGFRLYRGMLTAEHFVYIGIGMLSILADVYIANRIVDKLNANVIQKLTYAMIGVSGIVNLV